MTHPYTPRHPRPPRALAAPLLGGLALLGGCDLFTPTPDPFPVSATLEPTTVDLGVSQYDRNPPTAQVSLTNTSGSTLYVALGAPVAQDDAAEDIADLLTVGLPLFSTVAPGQTRLIPLGIDARTWRWRTGSYEVLLPLQVSYFFSGQAPDEAERPSASESPDRQIGAVNLTVTFEIDCDLDDDGFDDVACGGRDCDDTLGRIRPEGTEVCNDIDDDCDGAVDEGAVDRETFFRDRDEDTYGDPNDRVEACDEPDQGVWVDNADDCDDDDDRALPGGVEDCSNRKDDDCDGLIDTEDVEDCGF